MKTQPPDIDPETAWLVQRLVREGTVFGDAATVLTIEKLRRLEDLARHAGTSRQAFQKIVSARRILGDHAELGPIPDFMGDADMDPFDRDPFDLTEDELRVPTP